MVELGISYKQLKEKLEKIGFSPSSIKKVFISHEHTDHTKGIKTFIKNHPEVKIYMHFESFKKMCTSKTTTIENGDQFYFVNYNDTINHNEIEIKLIEGSHDSVNCFAFSLSSPNFKIFHATDIGYIGKHHFDHMYNSNFVLLESNYDFQMLRENKKYPMKTIQRICSNVGHLANDEAAKVVSRLNEETTKYVCFAHISENNNNYEKVRLANKHVDLNKYILLKDEIVSIDLKGQK